jgi:hypothetical protein
MTFKSFKSRARRLRISKDDIAARELLQGLWGVRLNDVANTSVAYLDHCNELVNFSSKEDGLRDTDRRDIIALVDIVRKNQAASIDKIIEKIRAAKPKWAPLIDDDDSAQSILDFALRLWLFIEPDLSNSSLTVSEVVKKCLPAPDALATYRNRHFKAATTSARATGSYSHPDDIWYLPRDLCEKSLTRKAAIKLEYTSYLSDHLALVGKSRLRIFRHASAIQQAAASSKDSPYPPGFLEETERTLALLFDPADKGTLKRTRRIQRRDAADLEAAMKSVVDLDERLDLRNYPFWQERLLAIQQVYDEAQPKTIKQWFFDDRNRINWATFWTAITVFILTVVFGVISSVTGAMQVYIAYNPSQAVSTT